MTNLFRSNKIKPLGHIHNILISKSKLYQKWHLNPSSSRVHYVLLASFALFAVAFSFYVVNPFGTTRVKAAGNYYVSSTSTNTTWSNCTNSNTPCSLGAATSNYVAGDVITLAPGTYSTRPSFSRSGTSSSHATFNGTTGVIFTKGITISGSYLDLSGFEVTTGQSGYDAGVEIRGTHNTLRDFNIHNITYGRGIFFQQGARYNLVDDFITNDTEGSGIWFELDSLHSEGHNYTSNNTVSNGEVTLWSNGGAEHAGVELQGTGNTIDGVHIHDNHPNTPNGYDGDGVRIAGSNLTVRNCTINRLSRYSIDAHTDGIQTFNWFGNALVENNTIGSFVFTGMQDVNFPLDGGTSDADSNMQMQDWFDNSPYQQSSMTIRNNVFLGAGYWASFNGGEEGHMNLTIVNNTFHTRGAQLFSGAGWYVYARNNLFSGSSVYSGTGKHYYSGMDTGNNPNINSDYNLYINSDNKPSNEGIHSAVIANPYFENPDVSSATTYGVNADFHLKSNSPAKGAGIVIPGVTPTTDKNGVARTAMDIGAFAYVPTGTSIISSLTLTNNKTRIMPVTGNKIVFTVNAKDSTGANLAGKTITASTTNVAPRTGTGDSITLSAITDSSGNASFSLVTTNTNLGDLVATFSAEGGAVTKNTTITAVKSGNINGDTSNLVNLSDFSMLMASWGTIPSSPYADVNGDGSGPVNLSDFSVLMANWGG